MHNGRALKKTDPSTIQDKLLVGYQGWFTCGGDGEPVGRGHHGWLHWFDYPVPDGGRPNTDIWPDVSEYEPSELYEAPGLRTQSGEKCYLFSSRNKKTVDRHFNWMAQHGVDGAFLQRFAGQCDGRGENDGIRKIRDEVGDRVREAAEKNGRVYAIMYDVSGVPPDKIEEIIKFDWKQLVFNKRIFDSPSYLREKGKPVVALWGFGFGDSRHTPGLVRSIASYLNSSNPGGVYLMAGVPAHWRTSTGDADRNPDFVNVWLDCFDAISPWTIGRYGNAAEADNFAQEKIAGDMRLITERNETVRSGRKLDYIPVVFPGGSGFNLSEGKWSFNGIPRDGGRFLWRQVYNARKHGVRTIYGAMWDEYDEGTALMPVVTQQNRLPVTVRDRYRFLAPDVDIPPDWYMRICGLVVEILRGERTILETFPQQELQDYWRTRPHYEGGITAGNVPANSTPGASGTGMAQMLAVEENPNEPPPPPYTLEVEDIPAKSASSTHDGFTTAPSSPSVQQNYGVPDLTTDLGRHTLADPSSQPSHPSFPGGFDSRPTSPSSANVVPPPQACANRPTSPPNPTPVQSQPSYFTPPTGPSQGVGVPPVAFPKPDLFSQRPDGSDIDTLTNPWGAAQPAPPIRISTKPTLPSQTTSSAPSMPGQLPSPALYPGQGHQQQYFYPGQTSYGPPPSISPVQGYGQHQSSYPGMSSTPAPGPPERPPTRPPTSSSPQLPQGYGQQQSSYPGITSSPASALPERVSSRPPTSSSPSLPQGFGQKQSAYPGMTSTPTPGPPERPPTRPPTSGSPPLPQGYGYQQSGYPGMTSAPTQQPPERPPTRPPTSQGHGLPQSSYPGMTGSPAPTQPDRPPTRPPTSQGYGQSQSSYPGMTDPPAPAQSERPPTRPPTSQGHGRPQPPYHGMANAPQERPPTRPPTSQGHGQPQSSYPGMTSSPAPTQPERPPTRPPTSQGHASRPSTPYDQSTLPPQPQPPPLPGRYDYHSGSIQPTYSGAGPSAIPPANASYPSPGPGSYGYQPPPQQHAPYSGYNTPQPGESPYPEYQGFQPPPVPPRQQDMPPTMPTSAGGTGGPGLNQSPYQSPYPPPQQSPPQSSGGPTTNLTYSASLSSSYSNATGSWKKQQTGVLGLAKDTVDKLAGKQTRKNVQSSVQSILKPFTK